MATEKLIQVPKQFILRPPTETFRRLYLRNESGSDNEFDIEIFAEGNNKPILKYYFTGGEDFPVDLGPEEKINKAKIVSYVTSDKKTERIIPIHKCIDRSDYSNDYVWYELTKTSDTKYTKKNDGRGPDRYILNLIIHED